MKIVVIGPIHPFRGGIAHSTTLLCENLSKSHDVLAISYKRLFPKLLFPGKAQKYDEKKKLPFPVIPVIDSINPVTWIRAVKTISAFQPDLVILEWWAGFLAPCSYQILHLLKKTGAKRCVYCQNVLPLERNMLDPILAKKVFSQADYCIVLSEEELKKLKALVPGAKAKVIIEPTYEAQFQDKIPKEQAKSRLGIKGSVAIFFGFVRPYKGLQYLLEAMPLVLKQIPLTLLVVGEFWGSKKPYLGLIKKHGLENNVIIIDRYIPDGDVHWYFSAADVCVMPYTHSTQSGILQVAMGYGVPVITSAVGSARDLITDGKTGLLVPPKDPKALSKAIISYFQKKLEQPFIKSIRQEKKKFAWSRAKESILFHGMDK
ncbi:glycosyltransferase [Candidatus Woesearchaeota archaeon]|nr:glycosyltransferase [Candidatus Woesearchaeota archaeon]